MKLTFDYINPMTGKKTVLLEGDRMLCVETGYHTFKGWNERDQLHIPFEQSSPDEIIRSKFTDDLGQVWFKITLFTDTIVLKPDVDTDGWIVNQFRDLYTDEIPGDKLQRVQGDKIQVLDPKTAIYCNRFEDALNEFDKLRLENE